MSLHKAIEKITEADLQELIEQKVGEGKTLDYKKTLNVENDHTKDEFRRDITSFANASGGDLIYGMKEKADEPGVPEELCGFEIQNIEAKKNQLTQILDAHIRPRVPNVKIKEILLSNGNYAFIVRIPQSYNKPHQVVIQEDKRKGDFQFWIRRESNKAQIDVDELRVAFTLGETLREKIRNFRMERLGNISSGATPTPLRKGVKIILHLIPIGAFDYSVKLQLPSRNNDLSRYAPLVDHETMPRPNFDGLLAINEERSYLQIFRNGVIESVYSARPMDTERQDLRWGEFQPHIEKGLLKYVSIQQEMGVQPPILIMLSLLDVKGYKVKETYWADNPRLDRNELILPEQVIEQFEFEPKAVMKPIFTQIWNAGGFDADYSGR